MAKHWLRRAPDGSVGAVFEGDLAFGEHVAEEVGGFEVFFLAEVLADGDEDLHGLFGGGVGGAGLFGGFEEHAEDAAQVEQVRCRSEDTLDCRLPIVDCRLRRLPARLTSGFGCGGRAH